MGTESLLGALILWSALSLESISSLDGRFPPILYHSFEEFYHVKEPRNETVEKAEKFLKRKDIWCCFDRIELCIRILETSRFM